MDCGRNGARSARGGIKHSRNGSDCIGGRACVASWDAHGIRDRGDGIRDGSRGGAPTTKDFRKRAEVVCFCGWVANVPSDELSSE